jgi:hypothetical protein
MPHATKANDEAIRQIVIFSPLEKYRKTLILQSVGSPDPENENDSTTFTCPSMVKKVILFVYFFNDKLIGFQGNGFQVERR